MKRGCGGAVSTLSSRPALELAERVYALMDRRAFVRLPELRDQMRRASLSVSNNIAEGFERGTTAELLAFLYVARGSAGETRSMLLFCQRLPQVKSEISNLKSEISNRQSEIPDLKSEISALIVLAESCSRQIRAWADQLQNSDIAGPRRLTDAGRESWQRGKRADAFLTRLQNIRAAAAAQAQSANPPAQISSLKSAISDRQSEISDPPSQISNLKSQI